MRLPGIISVLLPAILIASSVFAGEKPVADTVPVPATAIATFPNTAEGLQQFLSEAVNAAKSGNSEKVVSFVEEMEIPNYKVWFKEYLPKGSAESWISPHGKYFKKNKRAMQELLSSLAQRNGTIKVRTGNDIEYNVSYQLVDEAGRSTTYPLGRFIYIDRGFRWDGVVTFRIPDHDDEDTSLWNQVYKVGGGVTPPKLLFNVDPEYSQEARAAKFQGTVILWLIVDPDGKARNIRVERSIGMGLDEKAIEAVRQWRFKPAMKGNEPVAVQVNVEVKFRL
jgi:TonB family protein